MIVRVSVGYAAATQVQMYGCLASGVLGVLPWDAGIATKGERKHLLTGVGTPKKKSGDGRTMLPSMEPANLQTLLRTLSSLLPVVCVPLLNSGENDQLQSPIPKATILVLHSIPSHRITHV